MEGEKKKRGFAAMSPERHKAIASQGGKTAQKNGNSNKFTTETARAAGRRGHELGLTPQLTKETARAAGRKGAAESRRRRLESGSSERLYDVYLPGEDRRTITTTEVCDLLGSKAFYPSLRHMRVGSPRRVFESPGVWCEVVRVS